MRLPWQPCSPASSPARTLCPRPGAASPTRPPTSAPAAARGTSSPPSLPSLTRPPVAGERPASPGVSLSPAAAAPLGGWKLAVLALAIAAAAVVPYLAILDSPFVFDDVKFVTQNRFLRESYEHPAF